MKRITALLLAMIMLVAFMPAVYATEAERVSLNGDYLFKFYEGEFKDEIKNVTFDEIIKVPGSMEMQGFGYPGYFYETQSGWGMPENDGVKTAGVYKKEVSVSESGEYYIVFESFKDKIELYINGEKVGESKNGAIGAAFKVKLEKENEMIAVISRDKSGINREDNFALSGIMGDVYVTKEEPYDSAVGAKSIDGVILKGIRYTPTYPVDGIVSDKQIKEDLAIIEEYGFNAVWTSCAPEAFYEEAQGLGLYIIDEANVNLNDYDRNKDAAKARVAEMIKKHGKYENIVMWSVGFGDVSRAGELISYAKSLDTRAIAEEAVFAEDFKVFGNTGGMKEWVESLGKDNIGGFVDEFADKELYRKKNVYHFNIKDKVSGNTGVGGGEIRKHQGMNVLGDAFLSSMKIPEMKEFTIVADITEATGDRVIFESGNAKLEIHDYNAVFSAAGKDIACRVENGKIAAVYADGEIQLFYNGQFAGNALAEAALGADYNIKNGKTGVKYVEVYDKALTLDELLENKCEEHRVSAAEFDEISIIEDLSYDYLAYGGDFGDTPNSYYKCLTGIFTSLRKQKSEAKAFKALLTGEDGSGSYSLKYEKCEQTAPVIEKDKATFTKGDTAYTISFDGVITSIIKGGKELLSSPMKPSVHRNTTLAEYENGMYNEEDWRRSDAFVDGNTLNVRLKSRVNDGSILLGFTMYDDMLLVSMQSRFADDADKITFLGYKGAGEFDTAEWLGTKDTSYPDRVDYEQGRFTSLIKDMDDMYAVPQESGNRMVRDVKLSKLGDTLSFALLGDSNEFLHFTVKDYSDEASYDADHDEDIVKGDTAYFRVGGFMAGVGENRKYKLSENIYGCDFVIAADNIEYLPDLNAKSIEALYDLDEFTTNVHEYVHRTNESEETVKNGDYTIYTVPDDVFLSDMEEQEISGEIARDSDFSGNALTMRGRDYWSPSVMYDKGVCIKGGSVVYDVSKLDGYIFSAVVGKNDFDWRRMGGGFDRNMFEAESTVVIALDGKEVYKKEGIGIRGSNEEMSIALNGAKEMTITVTGNGRAPKYEDAVLANAAFVPEGPVVRGFERTETGVKITVVNTDRDFVDVVLSVTDGEKVTSKTARVKKGLYETISIEASKDARVEAVVTGLGRMELK